MIDKTINTNSNVGKRLKDVQKNENRYIIHGCKKHSMAQKITIGRDSTNTIVIDDKLVSRFHAVVQKIKTGYFIKDLDSSNGTFINDKKVEDDKYHRVRENDFIRLGRTILKVG